MHNEDQHNDPIEELFRNKAEEYDISYNEADWNRLEQRLDNWEQERARVNRWRWIAAACVLIIALLGYFTYENYQAIDRLNQQLAQEQAQNRLQEGSGNDTGSPAGDTQHESPGAASADSTDEVQPADTLTPTDELADDETRETQHPESNSSTTTPNSTTETAYTVTEEASRNLYIKEYYCPRCRFADLSPEGPLEEDPFDTKILAAATAPADERSAADLRDPGASAGDEYSPPNDDPLATRSRLSLGLVAGPDLSTVGALSNFSRAGYQIGIAAEYQLSSKLAISAGIHRSRVYYAVKNFSYSPGSSYNSTNTLIPHTDADCAILDIPITLKYDYLEMKRSRLFATAGLSSYIMLNEEYQFGYNGNAYGRPQRWSDRTGTRHWMSNLNISLGYELDVTNSWSIRAAPFVKIPIREVGWGQVELFSMGTAISVNYRL